MRLKLNVDTTEIKEREAKFTDLNDHIVNVSELINRFEATIVSDLICLREADFLNPYNTEESRLVLTFEALRDAWRSIIIERNVIDNISNQLNDLNNALTDEFVSDINSRIENSKCKMTELAQQMDGISSQIRVLTSNSIPDNARGYKIDLEKLAGNIKSISRRHAYANGVNFVETLEYVELVVDGCYNLSLISSISHARARSLGINEQQMKELQDNLRKAAIDTHNANEKFLEVY